MRHVGTVLLLLFLAAEISVLLRAMLRPHREPASRFAWLIVILIVPVLGVIAYLLLGEARISRKRRLRGIEIDALLPRPEGDAEAARRMAASPYAAPFALASSVNGLAPTIGNHAAVFGDSNSAIAAMIADIDAARETVHVCFYIWLADGNGLALKAAMVRAARRGVRVRVLADALGSRQFIRSAHWPEMRAAGIDARPALPVGGLVWTLIRGRVDLRNHRKQLIIDNRVAWCGSQNAADPEFRIKRRYAPWVDIMTRWEGHVARHCQFLFAADWMGEDGDEITALLTPHVPPAQRPDESVIAQVIGTGPSYPYPAMTACFAELVHSARNELVVTTPYFVPDEQLLFALIAAARRGVAVTLVLPRRNDSRIVAAASRSHYAALLQAGVALFEFGPGLLHAKTMVADREVGLIGSANLDRRSFELNFENNILFADAGFARDVRRQQDRYVARSERITAETVAAYGVGARLWQNLLAMMSPLL